jgi:hypothetical protein
MFLPTLLVMYIFAGLLAEYYPGGSDALQRKYAQPLLIGIWLSTVVLYVACCICAGSRVWSNVSLFIGCPIYYLLLWSAAYVTFVPGYNWVTLFDHMLANFAEVLGWMSRLTACAFNLVIFIFFMMYRERLFRLMGLDTANLFRVNFWDIADPAYRERSFIGVKLAICYVKGDLPVGDESSQSNDLFIQVKCGDNEPVNTRVHDKARVSDGSFHKFNEILQVNIPKDTDSDEKMYILIMDQDAIQNDEIARKVLTMSEIYDTFFDPESFWYTVDKSLMVDPRYGLQLYRAGSPTPIPTQMAFKPFRLNFVDEDGEAEIAISILPADEKACEHLAPKGFFEQVGSYFGGNASDPSGPGADAHQQARVSLLPDGTYGP